MNNTPNKLTESQHQQLLFSWAEKYPELDVMYAIPNEGKRTIVTGAKHKAMGLKSGVPDICLPIASKGYNGLYIELKKDKNSTISKKQDEWLVKLNKNNYKALVCYGWENARDTILNYLGKGD